MNRKVKPITPAETRKLLEDEIPDEVFQAFNTLILENFDVSSGVSRVSYKKLFELVEGMLDNKIKSSWFRVENFYSQSGWTVEINNCDDPFFCFTEKKKH